MIRHRFDELFKKPNSRVEVIPDPHAAKVAYQGHGIRITVSYDKGVYRIDRSLDESDDRPLPFQAFLSPSHVFVRQCWDKIFPIAELRSRGRQLQHQPTEDRGSRYGLITIGYPGPPGNGGFLSGTIRGRFRRAGITHLRPITFGEQFVTEADQFAWNSTL